MRRYHVMVSVEARGLPPERRFVTLFDRLKLPARPDRAQLLAIFTEDAKAAFARKGESDVELESASVIQLFELPDPPEPPRDGRPVRYWRVGIEFVCHDIKFGGSTAAVFAWPEEPKDAALDSMCRMQLAVILSIRGDGPDYVDYTDVLAVTVEETAGPATYY